MNEPIAWKHKLNGDIQINTLEPKVYGPHWESTPLYALPIKDREADRLRFSDEGFNRWLDEVISDSGHTVYDQVFDICSAWHGWQNREYYSDPSKTLTDKQITEVLNEENVAEYHQGNWLVLPYAFARAILKKAQWE